MVALDKTTQEAVPIDEMPSMRVIPIEKLTERHQETAMMRWGSILMGRRMGKQNWSPEVAASGGLGRAGALTDDERSQIAAMGGKAKSRRGTTN